LTGEINQMDAWLYGYMVKKLYGKVIW
jgi:hypothetical protein